MGFAESSIKPELSSTRQSLRVVHSRESSHIFNRNQHTSSNSPCGQSLRSNEVIHTADADGKHCCSLFPTHEQLPIDRRRCLRRRFSLPVLPPGGIRSASFGDLGRRSLICFGDRILLWLFKAGTGFAGLGRDRRLNNEGQFELCGLVDSHAARGSRRRAQRAPRQSCIA